MIYHWIALLCFALAFILHWIFVRKNRHLSRFYSYPIMLLGFASLTSFLMQRGAIIGACPIGNPFEIITLIIWSSVFFYLIVSLAFSLNYLGFFTGGLATLILLILHTFPSLNYAYDVSDIHSSHIIGFHASLAVFSYGIFALLSLLALMYLIQFYGLTKRRAGSFFSLLPPLVKLESLQTWILASGVFVLSVALFVGSFSFLREIGEVPIYKLTATVFVWLVYSAVLFFKLLNRLVSARFAWMLMFGFVIALIALIPVDRARHEPKGETPVVSE